MGWIWSGCGGTEKQRAILPGQLHNDRRDIVRALWFLMDRGEAGEKKSCDRPEAVWASLG